MLTDTRKLLYYWRRLLDERVLFGGRRLITDAPHGRARQREALRSALIAKLPALKEITVEHDWCGWVCLTADFLPRVYHAEDDPTVHCDRLPGKRSCLRAVCGETARAPHRGGDAGEPIPTTTTPLPRFPLAALRRVGQRAMYAWYRYRDGKD